MRRENLADAEHFFEKLRPFIQMVNAAEVMVNEPNKVWVEHTDKGMVEYDAPDLDLNYFQKMGRALSNGKGMSDFDKSPYIDFEIPIDPKGYKNGTNTRGHRVILCLGKTIETGVALCIRIYRDESYPLTDYVKTPDDDKRLKNGRRNKDKLQQMLKDGENFVDVLIEAFRLRMNIVLVGGTNTGKTRFYNSLLKIADPNERTILVEDIKELDLTHLKNRVCILVSKQKGEDNISHGQVIDAANRLRPDRNILGEITIDNAYAVLRYVNIGNGVGATVHGNTPQDGMYAIRDNVMMTPGVSHSPDTVEDILRRNIGVFAQLQRVPGTNRRVISDLWIPNAREEKELST